MVATEYPLPIGKKLLKRLPGAHRVSRFSLPAGQVVSGSESVWVIFAQNSGHVGQELIGRSGGASGISVLSLPAGEVAAGCQGFGMVFPQHFDGVGE